MRAALTAAIVVTCLSSTFAAWPLFSATTELDEFLVVLTCYAGFESRIAAGRASRQGLRTVVVTNELKPETAELRKSVNETWIMYKGDHLEALAPFVAYKQQGKTFKFMFVGEDDTLFFREGARTAVSCLQETVPYFISDVAWFVSQEGKRHYLKAEAPRCVPRNYTGDMARLPKHFVQGCPCNVSDTPGEGSCGPHKMPSMEYFPHGGPGYILSAGLFQNVTLEVMEACLAGGSRELHSCLLKMGVGLTDPDPLWHPEGLTFFDPVPSPFLTHENIMEKAAYILGNLLRTAAGMCLDICQVEMRHLVSLHLNAARIGYTRTGEKRVGDFKDPGQRETAGQALLCAISRFYHREVLLRGGHGSASAAVFVDKYEAGLAAKADERLQAAKRLLQQMGGVFLEDVVDEEEKRKVGVGTMQRTRAGIAMSVARQALDLITQDVTNGTAI